MAYVIGDDCIACGTCIDECPAGAISEGDKYSINPDVCTECGTCADVCPSEARKQTDFMWFKQNGLPFGSPFLLFTLCAFSATPFDRSSCRCSSSVHSLV